MKMLIRALKALSDPNRMRVMKMLQRREMCVCELTEALGIAQPSVSRHMRILEEADLVEQRKAGPWVNYRVNPNPSNPYARDILDRLSGWLKDDREIQSLILKASVLDRNLICGRKPQRSEPAAVKDARP